MGYIIRNAKAEATPRHEVRCRICPRPIPAKTRHMVVGERDRFHIDCYLQRVAFEWALFNERVVDLKLKLELDGLTDMVGTKVGVEKGER